MYDFGHTDPIMVRVDAMSVGSEATLSLSSMSDRSQKMTKDKKKRKKQEVTKAPFFYFFITWWQTVGADRWSA